MPYANPKDPVVRAKIAARKARYVQTPKGRAIAKATSARFNAKATAKRRAEKAARAEAEARARAAPLESPWDALRLWKP